MAAGRPEPVALAERARMAIREAQAAVPLLGLET